MATTVPIQLPNPFLLSLSTTSVGLHCKAAFQILLHFHFQPHPPVYEYIFSQKEITNHLPPSLQKRAKAKNEVIWWQSNFWHRILATDVRQLLIHWLTNWMVMKEYVWSIRFVIIITCRIVWVYTVIPILKIYITLHWCYIIGSFKQFDFSFFVRLLW